MPNTDCPDPNAKKYLTFSDVSERYTVSRSTLYRLHHAGVLRIVKLGRASRIAAADVEAWAASLPAMGSRSNGTTPTTLTASMRRGRFSRRPHLLRAP